MKNIERTFYCFCVAVVLMNGLQSCANIVPPGGGPKDSLPPVLAKAVPKDSSTNVNTKKIILTFNEYVELQNAQENVIISPAPQNTPVIESKLKTVTVKLRDSLEPNTTYTIQFGNTIKDVNEGNAMKNFSYVFSTGNTIDSNTLRGKVLLAETGGVDSTLLVVLHNNLSDSAIRKHRPRYYTRIKGDGSFIFTNLPNAQFNVFVIPNDYSKRYDDSTKLFAFANNVVEVKPNTSNINLFAYEQAKRKEVPSTQSSTAKSNNKTAAEQDKRLRFSTNLESGNRQDILSNLDITFNRKITSFDTGKFLLTDTGFRVISNYKLILDSTRTKISIAFPWPKETAYKLVLLKDAATDSTGISISKNDTIRFFTKGDFDYGTVKLRFLNIDFSKNPVLQIFNGATFVESIPISQKEYYRSLFKPGEYSLRILFDTNKNGIWDAGNYRLKKQPEIVQVIEQKLNVRGNWDNEVDIKL